MSNYIVVDKNIMSGAPVVKGTRVPVEIILQRLKEGYNIDALHEDYPHISIETFEKVIDEIGKNVIKSYNGTSLS